VGPRDIGSRALHEALVGHEESGFEVVREDAPAPSQEDIGQLVERVGKRIPRFLQGREVIALVTAPGGGEVTVVPDETMGEITPPTQSTNSSGEGWSSRSISVGGRQMEAIRLNREIPAAASAIGLLAFHPGDRTRRGNAAALAGIAG
jgi:hypothetical protein